MPFFNTNQVPGVGSALTQPQVPAAGIPPADASQIGLWQKFREKLQTDPNFKMALMTTGLNLLRTPQLGETGFDVFADASLAGVGTLDQLRQRDRLAGREDQRDALAERRVAAAETGVEQRGTQGAATVSLGRDRLAESKRQFDERKKAGDFGPAGSGVTGGERVIAADVQALMTADPETYPSTPEGQAKARLLVRDLSGMNDRLGQARLLNRIVADIREHNAEAVTFGNATQLSEEEILQQAISTFRTITSSDVTEPVDELEGQTISHSSQGEGKVVKVGDDRYIVDFPGGATQPITGDQVRRLLGNVSTE